MDHSFTLSPHPPLPFRLEPSIYKTTSDKHIYIHGLYLGGTRAYINRYTKSIRPTNFQSREFILSIARLISQTRSINATSPHSPLQVLSVVPRHYPHKSTLHHRVSASSTNTSRHGCLDSHEEHELAVARLIRSMISNCLSSLCTPVV